MEQYPSISTAIINTPIYAYDKLDGSNIRAEWTRKNGFSKYGTRTRLLDSGHPFLGEAVGLFEEKYSDDLSRIFKKERWEKATVFFEYFGANSFAGWHDENEKHDVVLFDVHKYKQGLLTPPEFNKLFRNVHTAELLYHGKPNQEFVQSVKDSTLEGMNFEGVICKGGLDNRRRLIQFKVKSTAWVSKLKNKFGEGTPEYEALL